MKQTIFLFVLFFISGVFAAGAQIIYDDPTKIGVSIDPPPPTCPAGEGGSLSVYFTYNEDIVDPNTGWAEANLLKGLGATLYYYEEGAWEPSTIFYPLDGNVGLENFVISPIPVGSYTVVVGGMCNDDQHRDFTELESGTPSFSFTMYDHYAYNGYNDIMAPELEYVSKTPSLPNVNTGSVTLRIRGGVPPYSVAMSSDLDPNDPQFNRTEYYYDYTWDEYGNYTTEVTFDNLRAATGENGEQLAVYHFVVTDMYMEANGCPGDSIEVTVDAVAPLDASDDAVLIQPGETAHIAVLDNDLFDGTPQIIFNGHNDGLITGSLLAPGHGTISMNADGTTIDYVPADNTREGVDVFEYALRYPADERQETAKVFVVALNANRISCEDTETINFEKLNGYTCEWFNYENGNFDPYSDVEDDNGLFDNVSVSKANGNVQTLGLRISPDITAGMGAAPNEDIIPITVKFVPSAMEWTGNVDKDWNNSLNWISWNSPDGQNGGTFNPADGFVPMECTDVLIPAGLNNYPNLTDGVTDNTETEPACDDIWFEHGGVVARTDLLTYRKAHVELTLEPDRWYMTSAPLRYMFSGDYYKTTLCPREDHIRAYAQLFGKTNPETNVLNEESDWSKPFNNTEIPLPAGFGYAIWIDDETYGGESERVNGKHSIWFPKSDAERNIYYTGTCDVYQNRTYAGKADAVAGNLHHRFIYEEDSDWETTGDITLNTEAADQTGDHVIISNPFMWHLHFSDIHEANEDLIAYRYNILEGADDSEYDSWDGEIHGEEEGWIAPMQSVVVVAKKAFGTTGLKVNIRAAGQSAGGSQYDPLRSVRASELPPNGNLLIIRAGKDGRSSESYILRNAAASLNYSLDEGDSKSLFVAGVTEPVAVYTRSKERYSLELNQIPDFSVPVELGVRTSTTGEITLSFERVENFTSLYLYDTLTGTEVNLLETGEYTFTKETGELYLDGRFYLSAVSVSDTTTGLDDYGKTSFLLLNPSELVLKTIIPGAGANTLSIYNAHGQCIYHSDAVSGSCTISLPSQGLYIVKLNSEAKRIVIK